MSPQSDKQVRNSKTHRKCLAMLSIALFIAGVSTLIAQNRSNMKSPVVSLKFSPIKGDVVLMTLAPGHFHASLVQKVMYPGVSPVVSVYAPPGPDLDDHLNRVASYNRRPENPTKWEEKLYTGPDFFERMLAEKRGNVVVIARRRTAYSGLELKTEGNEWRIVIPDQHRSDHEAHFGQVMQRFLTFLQDGRLPAWETNNTITRYYTIITALEMAQRDKPKRVERRSGDPLD